MVCTFLPTALLFAAFVTTVYGSGTAPEKRNVNDLQDVCAEISSAISAQSEVFYPGSSTYDNDIYHWASSSSALSACTVEPGTAEDVGKILQILGETRTSFGVKSGGHSANPGFSSSSGVLIAMYRFNNVAYNPESETANVGTGLIWDDVYAALAPYNVSVLGARVSGVGVGGFVLGGGYSWKTNQYGLAVDSITQYELVKPDGSIVTVTEASDSELFFGLKGGFNNFGIVTQIVMKTYPQTLVWGGIIEYTGLSIQEVTEAAIKFSAENTDPRACMIMAYTCIATQPIITQIIFYDGPEKPEGVYDDFLNIEPALVDVGTKSLQDVIKLSPTNLTADLGFGGVFHTVPLLKHSPSVMQVILEEVFTRCASLTLVAGPIVSYNIEPFLPNFLSYGTMQTAYPPTRDIAYQPFNIFFAFALDLLDDVIFSAIRESADRIRDAAIADGQDISNAPLYPNYAIFDTPLEDMYGGNVGRLEALKQTVDPSNVMGLAGGWKF
ncbi:FAD-binding domain-containing protein [Amanita rubescens]|nr:FAD-binding domain-containing protein [Amanita rubescens]